MPYPSNSRDLHFYNKIRVPPTLKRMKIIIDFVDVKPSLEISALIFHNLNITQITFSDVCNLQNVVKASFDVFPSSSYSSLDNYLLKILGVLSGIKHLALSRSTSKVWFFLPRVILLWMTIY